MNQHQITGLGPVRPDGSRFIFTRLPAPFIATAAWLTAQTHTPAVGDILTMAKDNSFTVMTEQQATEAAAALTAAKTAAEEQQKKSLGDTGSEGGAPESPFKEYRSAPVHAAEIVAVDHQAQDGSYTVHFSDGSHKLASAEMLSGLIPLVGDYWVEHNNGANTEEYVTSKDLFEAWYQPK